MKKSLFVIGLFVYLGSSAQKIDSIAFHLYTDSLKKGVHNYINVDGKTTDGKWKPLGPKEITFTSTLGTFEGNDLILPADTKTEWLEVSAVLKADPAQTIKTKIWIKKLPDPDRLPTEDEILNRRSDTTSKRSKKNKN